MRQALGLSNTLLAMNPTPWGTNWGGMMLEPFMRAFLANQNGEASAAVPAAVGPATSDAEPHSNGTATDLKTQIEELKHEVHELRKELRQK